MLLGHIATPPPFLCVVQRETAREEFWGSLPSSALPLAVESVKSPSGVSSRTALYYLETVEGQQVIAAPALCTEDNHLVCRAFGQFVEDYQDLLNLGVNECWHLKNLSMPAVAERLPCALCQHFRADGSSTWVLLRHGLKAWPVEIVSPEFHKGKVHGSLACASKLRGQTTSACSITVASSPPDFIDPVARNQPSGEQDIEMGTRVTRSASDLGMDSFNKQPLKELWTAPHTNIDLHLYLVLQGNKGSGSISYHCTCSGLICRLGSWSTSIADEISELIKRPKLEAGICYDPGAPLLYLQSSVDRLVATPGRLMHHILILQKVLHLSIFLIW
ncbi:uncharacterized protein LOC131310057 [Rhododendron vialii]|uniref:uncharacterized protein LOC131310057 n=1 Tax=Rhododendron vialii TaxID=182163 RepID=UPI00265E52F0|nr:uncharacterized protein LOC131310057 [Rhododendron vialii]